MQATWYWSVSKWGECLSFCQNAIKIIKMRNRRTVSDSIYSGPEAAGSWVTQGRCHSGADRDTKGHWGSWVRCWHRHPGFVKHTEARRGKSLREKNTNLRPDLKIWFKVRTVSLFRKKETKEMPFCNCILFAWEISFFFPEKQVYVVSV